jgi:hypothetical protein
MWLPILQLCGSTAKQSCKARLIIKFERLNRRLLPSMQFFLQSFFFCDSATEHQDNISRTYQDIRKIALPRKTKETDDRENFILIL